MSLTVSIPRSMAARKPPHGAPCNRCGACCHATLCPLAQHVFGGRQIGPCPALLMAGDESTCGLVASPIAFSMVRTLKNGASAMSAAARFLIGAATGCDARINGEPKNEAFYAVLQQWDREHKREVRDAKEMWGVR